MIPLPTPARKVVYNESKGYAFDAYTADQMHAYAAACVAAETAALRKDNANMLWALREIARLAAAPPIVSDDTIRGIAVEAIIRADSAGAD